MLRGTNPLCSVIFELLLLMQVERAFSVCGTIEYMAPEIVEGGESGHDKVNLVFYAVGRTIKSNSLESPFSALQCVHSSVRFFC